MGDEDPKVESKHKTPNNFQSFAPFCICKSPGNLKFTK